MNCVVMPRAVECTCCREFPEVEEHLEEGVACVASLEVFKAVFLDKDVLYTVLVTMHMVRGDEVETIIINRSGNHMLVVNFMTKCSLDHIG